MQKYYFANRYGVCSDKIYKIFKTLLLEEMEQHREFDNSKFIWRIGENVFYKIKNYLYEFGVCEITPKIKKLLDIEFEVLPPGDHSNWIILEKKPVRSGSMLNIDVSKLYPSEMSKKKLVGDITHGYRYIDADKADAIVDIGKNIQDDYMNKLKEKEIKYMPPKNCDVAATMIAYHQMYKRKTKKGVDFMNMIKKVIFNDPATIVYWFDGTKTVVKAEGEPFDPEKGLSMAIAKKYFGNHGNYYEVFKKFLPKEEKAKTQSEEQEAYLCVRDLAVKNGVSESAIRKRINAGKYPNAKKINGVWWIPYSEG